MSTTIHDGNSAIVTRFAGRKPTIRYQVNSYRDGAWKEADLSDEDWRVVCTAILGDIVARRVVPIEDVIAELRARAERTVPE